MHTKNLSAVEKLALPAAVVYTLALIVLSLITIDELPDIGTDYDDKIFHVIAYFILPILWYFGLKRPEQISKILKIGLLCAIFGIIIEALQGTVNSNRAGDMIDAVANFIGILLASILLIKLRKRLS